jgi:hypothetical protein
VLWELLRECGKVVEDDLREFELGGDLKRKV